MILRTVTAICCVVLFAAGAWSQSFTLIYAAGACLTLLLLLLMFHFMESDKIICPNCRSQILKSRRCGKHRNAKKILGSYTLRVAFQIVFSKRFRCFYCDKTYQWRGERHT